ncbi:MAG: toxin secretion/phage lysis holin [Herbinix sp.]|jgi:toxin secretion/phage lysis holin|nr:toxin secretion/phage lysis holin [Herbinix sp.]
MKQILCSIFGAVGSGLAYLFGGWDAALITLVIFMGIDFITGLIVAGVFKKSTKTETGALESKAGFKGLCRKFMIFFYVLIATRLDMMLGGEFIRNAVIIGFIVNETISITENAGLMGLPLPKSISGAIDLLKKKEGDTDE